MTPRDQELLDKQLRAIDHRPAEGVLMLAIAAVFFAGMAFGGFLFAYTDQPPLRMAANDIAMHSPQPVLSQPGLSQPVLSQPVLPTTR
jgi:hypothetical protein